MKNKRLITENWYKFLNEMDESSAETARALEEIAQLEAMVENLEETAMVYKARIEFLREQISFDDHSASQIKEDKDG
jgi:hypothetical protein